MVAIGFFGGVLGFIVGLISSRLVTTGGTPGFFKGLGLAWAILIVINGVAALVSWSLADS